MKVDYFFPIILTVSVMFSPLAHAQDRPAVDEKSKGQKIGEIINDAFQAAFPSIDGIVKLIGKITNTEDSQKKKKNQQESSSDQTLKSEVESYQTSLRNQGKKELKKLTKFSDQLLLLDKFLQPGVKIQNLASEMNGILAAHSQLTSSDWGEIENRHKKIVLQMAKISDIPDDNIKNFFQNDFAIRTALFDVKGANEDVIVDIKTHFDAKNSKKLENSTQELLTIFQHITAIVGLKLVDLQMDFKEIGDGGAQGAEQEKRSSGIDSVYKNVLLVKLKKGK